MSIIEALRPAVGKKALTPLPEKKRHIQILELGIPGLTQKSQCEQCNKVSVADTLKNHTDTPLPTRCPLQD